MPQYLLLNYQTSGLDCTSQVLVPEFLFDAMSASTYWRSIRHNGKYSVNEKKEAKYEMNDAINDVILFLNPINLQETDNTQDAVVKW